MKYVVEEDVRSFKAWSGAVETLDRIIEEGKEEELESLIEEMYCDELPTDTQINDFLWFESEYIYEQLGITEDEEDDDEEDDEDEESEE